MDYNHVFVCLMGMGTVFFGLICLIALSTLMSAVLRSVGKQPAAIFKSSMRSSTEKSVCLAGFTIAATISLSNILLARAIISRCPKVTGSKLPG